MYRSDAYEAYLTKIFFLLYSKVCEIIDENDEAPHTCD